MGLSASQARLLSITARISDNELRAQSINNAKMRLAAQSSRASEKYINALNKANLMFTNYDEFGTSTTQALSYNSLMGYSAYNNQYALINSAGQMLVSEDEAAMFEASGRNLTNYLEQHGLEWNTTYFDGGENAGVAKDLQKIVAEEYAKQQASEEYASPIIYGISNDTVEKVVNGEVSNEDLKKYYDNYEANMATGIYDNYKAYYKNYQEQYKLLLEKSNAYFGEYVGKYMSAYKEHLDGMVSDENGNMSAYNNKIASMYEYALNNMVYSTGFGSYISEDARTKIQSLVEKYEDGSIDTVNYNRRIYDDVTPTADIGTAPEWSDGKARSFVFEMDAVNMSVFVNEDLKVTGFKFKTNEGYTDNESVAQIEKNFVQSQIGSHPNYYDGSKSIEEIFRDDSFFYMLPATDNVAVSSPYLSVSLNAVKIDNYNYSVKYTPKPLGILNNSLLDEYSDKNIHFNKNNIKACEQAYAGVLSTDLFNAVSDVIIKDFMSNPDTQESFLTMYFAKSGITEDEQAAIDKYIETVKALKSLIVDTSTNEGKYYVESDYYSRKSIDNIIDEVKTRSYLNLSKNYTDNIQPIEIVNMMVAEYGEPKYSWIDKFDASNNSNPEAKAQWYTNLFNRMMQGYRTIESGLASSVEWLQSALETGVVSLEQVDLNFQWNALNYKSCTNITEEADSSAAVAEAEAEYTRAMNDIKAKDSIYDLQLKNIDTEHNSLQEEYNSIKSVIKSNIDRTMKFDQSG